MAGLGVPLLAVTMQSERGCLSRSGVRKPVAQGFATAPAGAFALTFW